jgi:hypothetical protein
MDYLASFFAGVFLCNCIPHLACGLRGEPFPTPFANPRGKGPSTPILNFLWGAFDLLAGLYLPAAAGARAPAPLVGKAGFPVRVVGIPAVKTTKRIP